MLNVELNMKKLCEAVLGLRARKETTADLGDNQVVYNMTPVERLDIDSTNNTLTLSAVIELIPMIRVVVYCSPRQQGDMEVEFDWLATLQAGKPGTSQDVLSLRHVIVVMGESGVETAMLQSSLDFTRLEKYVFQFPADSAIVLMICRGMDSPY